MGNDENTGCEKSVVIWLIIGVLAIVFANIATIEVAAISVCGLLIIWLLYYLFKRISNKKKLIKVMVVTIRILSAITLVIVFCGNFFLEHHKLILVAILVSAFIVFVIWHIYKNSKEKEIEQEKQIEQGKKTEQDTTTFIHTEYDRIIKEYPLGLKEWNKTIVNKPIDNYEKLVVYNENKIKQLEQLMMNYNRIKAFFPLGYDEWYRNLPANKATNCIEWAVKEEQIIKQLEQDYLDKIKKENEAKIAREKEIRQQQENEQFQKLLSEYKHLTSEFPYGFSKWRNIHPDLSDTERMNLAIREKAQIIKLEEEHLRGDYDKIVELYPHGWHEWDKALNKNNIESYLCLAVKNEQTIKQLEDEWQRINRKNLLLEYYRILEQYPHGWCMWYKTVIDKPIDNYVRLFVENEDEIKRLEDLFHNEKKDDSSAFRDFVNQVVKERQSSLYDKYFFILKYYPYGWQDWHQNYINTPIDNYVRLVVENEEVIIQKNDVSPEKILEISEAYKNFVAPPVFKMLESLNGVPYYYFFEYYPKNIFEELPDRDSNVRKFIWDFKDGRKSIVNMVSLKLERMFRRDLKNLTFVCIPASNLAEHRFRYEQFMNKVCLNTGMSNGYSHVTIIEEGEKKHMGENKKVQYYCDREYFHNRLVVVFDDIITHGNSLSKMTIELYKAGAKVVLALFLGKTFKYKNNKGHPWMKEQFLYSGYLPITGDESEEELAQHKANIAKVEKEILHGDMDIRTVDDVLDELNSYDATRSRRLRRPPSKKT